MNDEKLKNLLGLAQRAGKLTSGNFSVKESINSGKVKLLILATDAAPNGVKEFEKISREKKLPIVRALTGETLGKCLGKNFRTVAAISDEGFAKSIIKISDGKDGGKK